MKKTVSLTMALMLALSLSLSAFAENGPPEGTPPSPAGPWTRCSGPGPTPQ